MSYFSQYVPIALEKICTRKTLLISLVVLALAGVLAILCAHMWMHRFFNVDDVYIIYRYAENVGSGKGFVFNEGERVEGSSTFLYTLLLALPLAFGAEVVVTSKIMGAIATLALVILVFLYVKTVLEDTWGNILAIAAALLVSVATPVAVWSMSGMETNLYACLLLAGLYFYARFLKGISSGRTWPLLMAAASLTRPEGFAFFFLILLLNFGSDIWRSRGFKHPVKDNLKHLLWFSIVFAPFLVFRLVYFGEILPNSVIAKSTFQENLLHAGFKNMVSMIVHGRGVRIIGQFLSKRFGFTLLIALFPFLLKSARWSNLVLLSSAAGIFAVCTWNEGDWMPHARLLVASIPIIVVSSCLGLRVLFEIEVKSFTGRWMALVVTLAVVAWSARNLYYLHEPEKYVYERHLALIEMGKKLNTVREKDDILATDIAGRVAFYSKMRTIDLMGLCDRYIAHHGVRGGMYGKNDKNYALGKKPAFIVVNNVFEWQSWLRIPAFKDSYWFVAMPDYSRWLQLMFVRRDRKNLEKVRAVFHAELADPAGELKRMKK
jgi:arabinofuranosyltransferase